MKTLLAAFAALAFAAPAAEAAPDVRFRFDPCDGPVLRIGSPRFAVEFGGRCNPVHHHRYRTVCEREWVPPLWQTCVVGYDHCRRPIYRQVLVREGYWQRVEYRVCDCGQRTRC